MDEFSQAFATPTAMKEPTWMSPELRTAIDTGWQATYSLLFDRHNRPFVPNLAPHHAKAIRWHWAARHRICRTEIMLRQRLSGFTKSSRRRVLKKWRERQPRYMADFPMWSRGHMKSTVARRIAIVDALITLYYALPGGYCLYVGGTDAKTNKHAISVSRLLQDCVRPHCPALAEVRKETEGGRTLGWRAEFFYTRAGFVFHFGSLQSGLAGGNVDDIRPTLIILDDIDDRKNSPVQAEKNFDLLTSEILPMGAGGTLTFWAQNLINRYSCMYRIHKGHAKVLTDRRPSEPVPAIIGLKHEERRVGNTVRDVIVAGEPTWRFFDLAACQAELNRMGLPAFLRECQHEVELTAEGAMIHTYDDSVHPISVSEFAAVFGSRRVPSSWPKEWGNDWARTKTAKHANVALWRTVSPQGSPLPGLQFYFAPMSFPANAQPEDVAERVLSVLDETATVDKGTERRMTWAELRRDELLRANALLHAKTQLERIEYERKVLAEVIPQYSEPLLVREHVLGGVNSHEREDIRLLYNIVYALKCRGVNPGKWGGVEQINRDFAVDPNEDHPFRPGQKGFSRTYVIVPDDTSREPMAFRMKDGRDVLVYPPHPFPTDIRPDDLHDDRLYRYQLVNWRQAEPKLTETGERIDEPLKMDDDFGNLMQMFLMAGQIENTPLTVKDEFKMLVEAKMPELADGTIVMKDKATQQRAEAVRLFAEEELREKYGKDADEDVFADESLGEVENWWD